MNYRSGAPAPRLRAVTYLIIWVSDRYGIEVGKVGTSGHLGDIQRVLSEDVAALQEAESDSGKVLRLERVDDLSYNLNYGYEGDDDQEDQYLLSYFAFAVE